MLGKIRRSFRRKKESYCINCGHVTNRCSHNRDVYENVEFGQDHKDDVLKWLDLDLSHGGISSTKHKHQVFRNLIVLESSQSLMIAIS